MQTYIYSTSWLATRTASLVLLSHFRLPLQGLGLSPTSRLAPRPHHFLPAFLLPPPAPVSPLFFAASLARPSGTLTCPLRLSFEGSWSGLLLSRRLRSERRSIACDWEDGEPRFLLPILTTVSACEEGSNWSEVNIELQSYVLGGRSVSLTVVVVDEERCCRMTGPTGQTLSSARVENTPLRLCSNLTAIASRGERYTEREQLRICGDELAKCEP